MPFTLPWSRLFTDDVLEQLETVGGQPVLEVYYTAAHGPNTNTEEFLRACCQAANTQHFSGGRSLIKHTDSGNHSHTGPGHLLERRAL